MIKLVFRHAYLLGVSGNSLGKDFRFFDNNDIPTWGPFYLKLKTHF